MDPADVAAGDRLLAESRAAEAAALANPNGTATADRLDPLDWPAPETAETAETAEAGSEPLPLFVDVAALLDGRQPDAPTPTLCHRDDGTALFYPAAVNVVFGDPECGKTWLCLAASTEALAAGRRVLVVDADHNGAAQVVARLLSLGATPDLLRDPDRFRLAEPEDAGHLLAAVTEAETWRPAVAVVDSIGEVLPLLGLSSSNPDDYTDGARRVLRPLARSGAAVLAVDHLAQSAESRRLGPTGTLAKRRAVTGLSLRVTIRDTFTPERGGSAWLRVHKDRAGAVRAVCPTEPGGREQPAGVFRLDPLPSGGVRWQVTDPAADRSRPAPDADVAEVDGLDPAERSSVVKVKRACGWSTDRAAAALRTWRAGQDDGGQA